MGTALTHEEVRDLYWILKGPALLNSSHAAFGDLLLSDKWFEQQTQEGEEWFRTCNQSPEALQKELSSRAHPAYLLGRYFEALVSYWIRDYLKPEIFYANVPVHEHNASIPKQGRRTIGEYDFIFNHPTRGLHESGAYHLEAAVKFFLFSGESDEQAADMKFYLGTFVRDRLDIKVRRIFDHQLMLSKTEAGSATLAKLGFQSVLAKAWVKGFLFYPSQSDWQNHVCPPEVLPHHSRGWWTDVNKMEIPSHGSENRWVLLAKHRWLSPVYVSPSVEPRAELLNESEMKNYTRLHFSHHVTPLMWAELEQDSVSGAWNEVARGLVVFSGWLAAARSASNLKA